jgi:hypothetical protein
LALFAWIGRAWLSSGLGTLLLIGAAAVVFARFRRDLQAVLTYLDRSPALRPLWRFQATIPAPLRKIMAFLSPFIVSFMLNNFISGIFQGFGFMVAYTLILINVLVAQFFLHQPRAAA